MLTRLRAKLLNIVLPNETSQLNFKKPSEKQQLQWLQDNYIAVHILMQNIYNVETVRFPLISELFYSHKIRDLRGKPIMIARQLLKNPLLTCENINFNNYFKSLCGTFFFICREFLELFGHSQHIVFKELKEKFNNWKYNINIHEVMRQTRARNNIFNSINTLKCINNISSPHISTDKISQIRIQAQFNCLYFLSCLTMSYKNITQLTEQEEIEMKIDMEIFHIDINHPFNYTPIDIYAYLYSSETLFNYELSRFRKIILSKWLQEKPEECPVCLEEINCDEHLSCGHYVHKKCVIKSKKTCCPMCKGEVVLESTELKEIFFNN